MKEKVIDTTEIKTEKKKKSKSKRVIAWIIVVILILSSLGVAGYPFISDWWNSRIKEQEIVQYLDYIAEPPADKYAEILQRAREYNQKLVGEPVFGDPFTQLIHEPEDYYNQLVIPQTDVMASIRIPKINVNLPVFHGTSAESLNNGAGHVAFSSLPVGGEGCHSVISAHTGSATQRFFSDLNLLETGDVFFINCLGEELSYKVDQILVVTPDDSSALQILPDKDYCTLVTCTPFGINSHRLLVRGVRCDLSEAEKVEEETETVESTWDREYFKAILLGLAVMGLILLVFIIVRLIAGASKKRKKKEENADGSKQKHKR